MPTDLFLDFDSDPGLQICDRCHRVDLTQWLAGMLLCQACLHPVIDGKQQELADIVGLNAVGKAAERLSEVWGQNQEMRRKLGDAHGFLLGVSERSESKAAGIAELLERVARPWLTPGEEHE